MDTRTKRRLLTVGAIVLGIALSLTGGLLGVVQALGEYLYPTTVVTMELPAACIATGGTPPPDLMRILENQRRLYNLSVQRVTTCTSARSLSWLDPHFAALGEEERERWRPLDKGCCSCQHGRHVVVEAAAPSGTGSIVVQAALIQSRWDYLRLKASEVWGSWVWRWCRSGAVALLSALHRRASNP